MNYLDVDTFRELLRTDLWDWKHLLSDRILFDYCNYLCIRESAEIQRYCNTLHLSSSEDSLEKHENSCDSTHYLSDFEHFEYSAFDSSLSTDIEVEDDEYSESPDQYPEHSVDSMDGQDDIETVAFSNELSDEEQNFAILKVQSDCPIDEHFILSQFKTLDIINDRFSLTKYRDIGLHSNLCKQLTVHSLDMDDVNLPQCTLKRSRNDRHRPNRYRNDRLRVDHHRTHLRARSVGDSSRCLDHIENDRAQTDSVQTVAKFEGTCDLMISNQTADLNPNANLVRTEGVKADALRARDGRTDDTMDGTVFGSNSFSELARRLRDDGYYTDSDLSHIENLLMTDLLSICVDEWYFVEWLTDGELDEQREFQRVETKQMILGRFASATYKKKENCHFFIAWSIERHRYIQLES